MRLVVAAFLLLSACTIGNGKPATLTQIKDPAVTGAASFDAMEVDQQARRLYVADRTDSGIDVFDTSTAPAAYLTTITLPANPNGLAFAADLQRLYVGQADGNLAIIDANPKAATPYGVIKQVPTGGKTVDLIDYARSRHEVFASNAPDGTIARVDATTGELNGQIKVGFGLEQPRFNPVDNLLYVTSPDAGSMFQLDPASGAIKSRIDLGSCLGHGLAINPKKNQALIACSTWVERINLRNTGDRTVFSEVAGGDLVTYDAAADRFLVAAPDAIPSSVALFGGDPIVFLGSVKTSSKGNSAALDERTGIVFTPDVRAGKAGLISFNMPTGEVGFSIDSSALIELGVVVAVVILIMVVIGRQADPVRRSEPLASRRRA